MPNPLKYMGFSISAPSFAVDRFHPIYDDSAFKTWRFFMSRFCFLALAALLLATPALAQEKGVLFSPESLAGSAHPKITPFENGIEITSKWPTTITLGRVSLKDKKIDQSYIAYSADMQAVNITGKAYLEMWVRFESEGFFSSRGFDKPLDKDSGWRSFSTPLVLKKGAQPDEIVLNIRFDGAGTLRVRNVELAYLRGAGEAQAEEKSATEKPAQKQPADEKEKAEEKKE